MNKFLLCMLLLWLIACNPEGNRTVDREKIKQEMNDRQIKRVSDSALMEAAFQTGEKLVSEAESILLKKLNNLPKVIHSDSGVVVGKESYLTYTELTMAMLDSLNQGIDHRISLISMNLQNVHPDTSDIERQLLDAYQYNIENDIPLEDNVQKSGTDNLLFTRAITSKTGICLSDRPSQQITYFCGMWSIKLSKKGIIRSL